MILKPIIETIELAKLQQESSAILVLIDASNHKEARANYTLKHLDGAIFVDSNLQLASIGEDASKGGRHPLPTAQQFGITLQDLGISPTSHVVIYDDKNGSNSAARLWWMLRAIGHERVQVLNGGMQEAIKQGYPTNDNNVIIPKAAVYPCQEWLLPQATLVEVEENALKDDYLVVDVRETSRFKGYNEPIDLVAGHIPGAVNIPFSTNLDEQGKFLSPEILRATYSNLFQDKKEIAVHCGSGVTACLTLLAIDYAGLPIPKLYVGSWSEWSRNNKTIAVEE